MIEFSDSQVRRIEDRLRRIESQAKGDNRTANNVRVALLEINKARRKAERRKDA